MEDAAVQRGPGVRTVPPEPRDLSPQRWVGERAAGLLPSVAERLWQGALPYRPVLVFLGGSAVHGELCGIEGPDGEPIYLSDLDFGILTAERVPGETQQAIRGGLDAGGTKGPALRAGFYCRADLRRQHPTPGLVETVRNGLVLRGDPAGLAEFRVPAPEAIPRWESRRLLCNRALGLLEGLDPACRPVDRVYALSKLAADAAAVLLLHHRSFAGGGFAERARAARLLPVAEPLGARIAAWTAWRLEPLWASTPLGRGVAEVETARVLEEARELIERILRSIAPGDPSTRGVLTPVGVRGRAWARSWKRWSRREPGAPWRAGTAALSRTPRILLWEAALGLLLGDLPSSERLMSHTLGGRAEGFEALRLVVVQSAEAMEHEGVE